MKGGTVRESVEARQRRILDVVSQHGEVKVAHLAALTKVSMVTIRRDLEALNREGAVERRHGMVSRAGEVTSRAPLGDGNQGTVAIIAPERHSYLNEVTQGARRFLEHAGYRVVLHLTPNTADPERTLVEQVMDSTADGLLLAPRWRTREQEQVAGEVLAQLEMPTVLVERRPAPGPAMQHVDSVRSDHNHGVRLAVEHLVSAGHRRILLAARQDSPTARSVTSAFARIAGEHRELEHWMSVLSSPDAAPEEGRWESADDVAGSVSAEHPDYSDPGWLTSLLREESFTAALLHSDENALVLTQRLALAGIRVPQDCAVIAYDDVVAGLGSVPLTAVAPPKAEVGRSAAELLGQRIRAARDGRSWTPRRIELLPSLEIRSST